MTILEIILNRLLYLKSIKLFALIIGIQIIFISNQLYMVSSLSDLSLYENEELGFRFTYPNNWLPTSGLDRLDPGVLVSIPGPNSDGPPYLYNFAIYVIPSIIFSLQLQEVDVTMSNVNEIVNAWKSKVIGLSFDEQEKMLLDAYKKHHDNFEILSSSDTTFLGYPAKKLIYTFSEGGMETKETMTFFLKGDNIYSIRYFGPVEGYSDIQPKVEQVIESIEITNSPEYRYSIE